MRGERRRAIASFATSTIPGEIFIQVEFASVDDARVGRERLLGSGVLDRFDDKTGSTLVEEAESVRY